MAALLGSKALKEKLLKQWCQHKIQRQALDPSTDDVFPLSIKLARPSDQQFMQQYLAVQSWVKDMDKLAQSPGIELGKQQINYQKMGRQILPTKICFTHIEALARFLGCWQGWQKLASDFKLVCSRYAHLQTWLLDNLALLDKHHGQWSKLLTVVDFFIANPKPGCYLRQIDLPDIDSKFIEQHMRVLTSLLDRLLDEKDINQQVTGLREHGFEKRFGLLFEQPQIRFRILDPLLADDFCGATDLSLSVKEFAQLQLLLDKVFITENKANGLAFPPVNNAIVIFGLGYGVQSIKQITWLRDCRIYYWGDIDTHGFAILSQVRSYFSNTQSLLMDEATLLACKDQWGTEPDHKRHKAEHLEHLTNAEQQLYKRLKQDFWQNNLRLEQEFVPFHLLLETLSR